jgi:hypothetical protein
MKHGRASMTSREIMEDNGPGGRRTQWRPRGASAVLPCGNGRTFGVGTFYPGNAPRRIDISNGSTMMVGFRFAARMIGEWECGEAFATSVVKPATAPATVCGEFFSTKPLEWVSPGRRNRASTRKSGDRPEQSSIRRAVRALGAVLSL